MVKVTKKKPRKSLNASTWEESDNQSENGETQMEVAPPSSEESEDEAEQNLDDASEEEDQSEQEEAQSEEEDDDDGDEDQDEEEETSGKSKKIKLVTPLKKKKTGIVYLSSIPKHMNVTILRELLEPLGDVGRIYLQPQRKDGTIKKKTAKGKRAMIRYTEGWVEFKRKRVAKAIVQHLNTKPISTKKKSIFCDILWSMKYLPRFKWIHLSERLAYERAVFKQKLRTEIAQARKEATFFQSHLDQSDAVRKKARKEKKANKEE